MNVWSQLPKMHSQTHVCITSQAHIISGHVYARLCEDIGSARSYLVSEVQALKLRRYASTKRGKAITPALFESVSR